MKRFLAQAAKERKVDLEALEVVGTSFSPGLRRLMARAGSRDTFKEGREDLRVDAGVEVDAKDVERVAEQCGKAIAGWEAFGERMHGEAVRRGLARAEKVVVIGDGAKWIWELAALHFPGAVEIVDLCWGTGIPACR